MRRSRKQELIEYLSLFPEGRRVDEIIGEHPIVESRNLLGPGERYHVHYVVEWPRTTVFRLLKQLVDEHIVLKERDSKRDGKRGRPAVRYRLSPNITLAQEWLVKRIGRVWFPGKMHFTNLAKEHVRLSGKWKKDYEEHRAWLKEHEPEEYEKFLELERQKKHPSRRPTARS